MSVVTVTVPATLGSPTVSLAGPATFLTSYILTTVVGLPGQTLTLLPSSLPTSTTPTLTQYTPTATALPPVEIYTATEWIIAFQALDNRPWTTATYVDERVPPTPTAEPSVLVSIVVPNMDGGWGTWTHAQKGGLVAGLVLFVVLMVSLLWCMQHRRPDWVVNQGSSPRTGTMIQTGYRHYDWVGGHGRWGY